MADSIRLDEHVFIAGITGGGKTYLAENYLAVRPPVLKIDTKGEALKNLMEKKSPWPQVPAKQLAVILDTRTLFEHDFKRRPYVIYVPDEDESEIPGFWNGLFRWIFQSFKKSGLRVWIDELKDVNESPHTIEKYLKSIYTKGRFFRISIWGLAQEPRHIHSLTMSQASHVFTFDLPNKADRQKISDNTGCPEFLQLPTGYNFWYYQRGWRQAMLGLMAAPVKAIEGR